ncbi:MAG: hypothetical protein ACFE9L_07730 [Candidatus Hodarchaeota archaeon]
MQDNHRLFSQNEHYPEDRIWNPDIQEQILNEIRSDLFVYAFPSAMLHYINIENRILEILNLNQTDLRRYLEKCFLLRSNVIQFVFDLPQNIRSIEHHNDTHLSIETDEISGRINWPATLKASYNTPGYISRYSIHSNSKSYETPGNIILKDCVTTLWFMTTNVIQYFHLTSKESRGWQSTILKMHEILKISQKRILNCVSTNLPTSNDYIKTLKHKKYFYRTAAQVGFEIKDIETPDFLLETWYEFFHTIPENLDKLYEFYILLKITQGISIKLNRQPTLLLQGPRENWFFASFHQYPVSIFIYYQKAPFKSSMYGNTLEKYGLNLKKRIPDICIQIITKNEVKKNFLIEVKRTNDLQYLRASIYKVLGYLSDYSLDRNLYPFLVVWDLPKKNEKYSLDNTFLPLFCFSNLSSLIESIFNLIGEELEQTV